MSELYEYYNSVIQPFIAFYISMPIMIGLVIYGLFRAHRRKDWVFIVVAQLTFACLIVGLLWVSIYSDAQIPGKELLGWLALAAIAPLLIYNFWALWNSMR